MKINLSIKQPTVNNIVNYDDTELREHITALQENKAEKSEIPSIIELATEDYVDEKIDSIKFPSPYDDTELWEKIEEINETLDKIWEKINEEEDEDDNSSGDTINYNIDITFNETHKDNIYPMPLNCIIEDNNLLGEYDIIGIEWGTMYFKNCTINKFDFTNTIVSSFNYSAIHFTNVTFNITQGELDYFFQKLLDSGFYPNYDDSGVYMTNCNLTPSQDILDAIEYKGNTVVIN